MGKFKNLVIEQEQIVDELKDIKDKYEFFCDSELKFKVQEFSKWEKEDRIRWRNLTAELFSLKKKLNNDIQIIL